MSRKIRDFVEESNRIEGIEVATGQEVAAVHEFVGLPFLAVGDVVDLVGVFEPKAVLRDQPGLNVRVGPHIAPPGGPGIRTALEDILRNCERRTPYAVHVDYETLHPFTDGNGRSGRVLWLWTMYQTVPRVPSLGFLHTWYYQSLQGART